MSAHISRWLVVAIGLCVLACSTGASRVPAPSQRVEPSIQAAPVIGLGRPDQVPQDVSAAGADENGRPKSPTVIKGKTDPLGNFSLELINNTDEEATDLHLRVKTDGVEIDGLTAELPFQTVDLDGDGTADTRGNEVEVRTGPGQTHPSQKLPPGPMQQPRPAGAGIAVDVLLKDLGGLVVANRDVEIEVWWTRGVAFNRVVSNTSTKDIGDGDPPTGLLALDIPGWSPDPVDALVGSAEVGLPPLVLAERDKSRFGSGSLVLSPDSNTQFAMTEDFAIYAIDETGSKSKNKQLKVKMKNARIDSDGNFVVEIERNEADEKHVALVIAGLKLVRLESSVTPGAVITASGGGAVLRGKCISELFTLVKITTDEPPPDND